jgi:DNA-binding NtrC family response regulator
MAQNPARILSVSIDPSLLTTRAMILESAGYIVKSASTWMEFETACAEGDFDLVILGQSLPPSMKHDMQEFAHKHCRTAKVAELYLHAPNLPAKYSMQTSTDPKALLEFVTRTLSS